MNATEALAEAWASINGKLDEFRRGKVDAAYEDKAGYYEGYLSDASELIRRIEARGFKLVSVSEGEG